MAVQLASGDEVVVLEGSLQDVSRLDREETTCSCLQQCSRLRQRPSYANTRIRHSAEC